jgi:hypothetical protein
MQWLIAGCCSTIHLILRTPGHHRCQALNADLALQLQHACAQMPGQMVHAGQEQATPLQCYH